jgi:hypothetical protein
MRAPGPARIIGGMLPILVLAAAGMLIPSIAIWLADRLDRAAR